MNTFNRLDYDVVRRRRRSDLAERTSAGRGRDPDSDRRESYEIGHLSDLF